MSPAQFGLEMDRIKEVYGEKNYPEPRVTQIYLWAKNMHPVVFKGVVSKLIEECPNNFPPMLAKFKEFYTPVSNAFKAKQAKEECPWCGPPGVILGFWREDPMNVDLSEDFACPHCPAGKARKDLKFWQEHQSEKYIPRWERQEQMRQIVRQTFINKGDL